MQAIQLAGFDTRACQPLGISVVLAQIAAVRIKVPIFVSGEAGLVVSAWRAGTVTASSTSEIRSRILGRDNAMAISFRVADGSGFASAVGPRHPEGADRRICHGPSTPPAVETVPF